MILFFLPNLQGGGAERVLTTVLLELHQNHPSNNYALLLERKEGEFLKDIPTTIPIYSLNTSRAITSVLPLIKFCRLHRPKMIIATLGASFAASMAKPFVPKSIQIINRIGNTIGAEKNLYKSSLKKLVFLNANKVICRKSDHIIFQCNYMAKDYIKETGYRPKVYDVIYNPVDVENVMKKSNESVNTSYDLVAVGRLMAQKDYFTLLRGFAKLLEYKPTLSLAILGQGSLHDALLKEINLLGIGENVRLMGFVSNPYPFMKHARFLVSSSLYEGFSNVIIEALCLGTPVVVSDCPGGNNETIEIEENGMLFNVGDPISFADEMRSALNKEAEFDRASIAKNAIYLYDKRKIVNQYEQLIKKYIY